MSYDEALDLLTIACPRDMAIHGESIERNLKRMKAKKFEHKFFIEDFARPQLIRKPGKSIFLHGPSNTGKTHFACAHFENPLLVCDIDQLKHFRPEYHDGLVFDDMSFLHVPPEKVIHLVDQEFPRTIRCRHTNAEIPANTPKIFTHNMPNPFFSTEGPLAATPFQQVAINRRIESYNVPLPLYAKKQPMQPEMHVDELRANEVQEVYHCDGQ